MLASMRREGKKDDNGDNEEEEEEEEEEVGEGECFSVDSLESGKSGGRKFNSNKIKISTVSD